MIQLAMPLAQHLSGNYVFMDICALYIQWFYDTWAGSGPESQRAEQRKLYPWRTTHFAVVNSLFFSLFLNVEVFVCPHFFVLVFVFRAIVVLIRVVFIRVFYQISLKNWWHLQNVYQYKRKTEYDNIWLSPSNTLFLNNKKWRKFSIHMRWKV